MKKQYVRESINKNCTLHPFKINQYLNLPDLQFFIWCSGRYQINRGIYNTIDKWLFDYGMINIQSRRIQLLAFLDFIQSDLREQGGSRFIRFGHGGLKKRLSAFMKDQ